MRLDTGYLDLSIQTLESAFRLLQEEERGSILYGIYRSACVKEFEIVEEFCGSLLKKRIRPFFASNRDADKLAFKDIFRHAAKHVLITADECARWLQYRDTRNESAHLYGENYAVDVLAALPAFIPDAQDLASIVGQEIP